MVYGRCVLCVHLTIVRGKQTNLIIKNRCWGIGLSAAYLFYFSQKGINITRILLQNLRKEPPDKINILVATHELESFAIKYGKTHLTAKERAIVPQELFGEFGALFDESVFAYSVEY